VHEDPLSDPEPGAGHEHVPGGQERQRHGGGVRGIEPLGNGEDVAIGGDDPVGATAVARLPEDPVVPAERIVPRAARRADAARRSGAEHDLVAYGGTGGTGPQRIDDPGDVASRNDREREYVSGHSLPHPEIEVVEPHRAHPDPDLLGSGDRIGPLLEPQRFEAAVLADDDRAQPQRPRSIQTLLVSRYASIASSPSSRPNPDCLKPPKGSDGS